MSRREALGVYRVLLRAQRKCFYKDLDMQTSAILAIKEKFREPLIDDATEESRLRSIQDRISEARDAAEFLLSNIVQTQKNPDSPKTHSIFSS